MFYLKYANINSPHSSKNNTGLGNILFQLSFEYMIYKKYNLKISKLYFDIICSQIKNVNNNYDFMIYKKIEKIFQTKKVNENIDLILKESKCHFYDENLLNIIKNNLSKNIIIESSYLQSYKYFYNYEKDIQEIFSPTEEVLKKIYLKYPMLNDKTYITIGVHLRMNWRQDISYNNNLFILNSINNIKKKLNSEKQYIIFICSDDIIKAKKLFNNITENYYIFCENNLDYMDMWIMSLCEHNIICHSTLGWWSAYLNKNENKYVFYPKESLIFYSKLTNTNINIIKNNYYPEKWICLESKSMKY